GCLLFLLDRPTLLAELRRLARDQALAVGDDIVDCQEGQVLTMAPLVAITLLGFVLENNQFRTTALLRRGRQNQRLAHQRSSQHGVVGIRDQQHLLEANLVPNVNGQAIDFKRLADRDLVLSSTAFNNCKHLPFLSYTPRLTPLDTWQAWVERLAHCSLLSYTSAFSARGQRRLPAGARGI